ncbi:GNAT family N-acetyltransferase [Pedobacter sp. KR3-3]|uniref:GNAT family N-acetyltransferase n=1 Tax=Pedobacter albus TaxID=3113905 RepID=A0ABU7I4U0_9SPHI|nr:GNAT family N-acetyltransferase [Pedobacter sp. KR3-3]MEE1944473.1 GNAT family N-acetyltransferase [Pedobacter sp. KR3-3]
MNTEIIEYNTALQPYYEQLNIDWLQEFFAVEEADKWMLENPKEAILNNGGHILFAKRGHEIVGTVALKFSAPGVYELAKMTVAKTARGFGLGRVLCEAAIQKAKQLGATKVILYTNSKLQDAIHIYGKLGFEQIPVDKLEFVRIDTMMQLTLNTYHEQA